MNAEPLFPFGSVPRATQPEAGDVVVLSIKNSPPLHSTLAINGRHSPSYHIPLPFQHCTTLSHFASSQNRLGVTFQTRRYLSYILRRGIPFQHARSLAHVEINKSAILPTTISIDRTIGSDNLDLQHRTKCCSTPPSSPRSSPSLPLRLPQSPGSPGRVNTSTTTAGRGSTSRELHTNLKARSDLLPRPTMPSEYEDCDVSSITMLMN